MRSIILPVVLALLLGLVSTNTESVRLVAVITQDTLPQKYLSEAVSIFLIQIDEKGQCSVNYAYFFPDTLSVKAGVSLLFDGPSTSRYTNWFVVTTKDPRANREIQTDPPEVVFNAVLNENSHCISIGIG